MATPKRKRTTKRSTPKKRLKYTEPSDDEATPGEELWEAHSILQERRVGRKLQYLIKWKGIDPQTDEEYLPTWEPEENPTADLVATWQQEIAGRGSASTSEGVQGGRPRGQPKKQARQQLHLGRKSRTVQSSPEPSTARSSIASSRPSTPAQGSAAPGLPSSTVTTPIGVPLSPKHPSPKIQVGQRGGSFDPDEYERYSQLAASQPLSIESQTQGTDLDSSQLFSAVPEYRSSGVVPDSQSSAGEGSFAPTTQQTTGTTQQSSTANESQEEVTEDSGLLEIVRKATSRAPSPASSIPETVYDTTAESRIQRLEAASQKQTESPDTETADSSLPVVSEEAQHEDGQLQLHTSSQVVVQRESPQQDHTFAPEEQVAPPSPALEVTQPVEESSSQGVLQLGNQQTDTQCHTQPLLTVDPCESASQPGADASVDESHDVADLPLASTGSELILGETRENSVGIIGEQCKEAADSTSRSSVLQQAASQGNIEASLTEHSVLDHAAQFPVYSQHPPCHTSESAQPLKNLSVREEFELPLATGNLTVQTGTSSQLYLRETSPKETSAASLIEASSVNASQSSQTAGALLALSTDPEYEALVNEFLEPEFLRGQLPIGVQQAEIEVETVVQSTYASHSTGEEAVRRQDLTFDSQAPSLIDQPTDYPEQNAQLVHSNNESSTQEDTVESVRPSIEKTDVTGRLSPDSRHDSSQDSPERQLASAEHSSSPIPQPPSYSLDILASYVPARPITPIPTSSLTNMTTQDSGQDIKRQIQEHVARRQAENPYTPNRRVRNSNVSPTASITASAGTPSVLSSAKRLLRTGASPTITATEGTRSPSIVPDRSPAPPAPTSLRTVALSRASQVTAEETLKEAVEALSAEPPLKATQNIAPVVPAIIRTEPTAPELISSDVEELTDATDDDDDDDNASLLNDDLLLAVEEHIVPLFIEGRQSDEYSAHIKKNKDLLQGFMKEPHSYEPLARVEVLLSYLRAIETHMDLVFQEADLAFDDAMDPGTQIEFALQFGIENSIKFKFLHTLFHAMRNQQKHIVLVVEEDNDVLFNIIETFCKASFIQYNMPTKGRQADSTRVEGNLLVSVFSSNMSPIIRPADAIICLDGVQDATQIRQKNWASNPDLEVMPVLHLVISRTVGHIERYLSSSLGRRERIHTILASLASMLEDLGKPIDEDLLRAPAAAEQVAEWFEAKQIDRGMWPLGSIGSVKEVIEYQTQMSQESAASPVPERTKRPHDDDELDPAKRMRFTPQPQGAPSSSVNKNELTRISDSMPGTATDDVVTLRAQLARIEEAYDKERAARIAERNRFREEESMWNKQQTVHEDLTREYRLLLGKQQSTEEKLETSTRNNETLRDRLASRTVEMRTLTEQLDEQRKTHLLSEDEKITEITRLRTDLALANKEKDRAAKNEKAAEATLDYTKDQYRAAQTAATSSASAVAELEALNAKLSHAASGQPAKLKALHLDSQYRSLEMQLRSLKAENGILKKSLVTKEEELARAKLSGSRMGVGTRATSATPQPSKVRSRAASPMGGRLSNLRNG